MPRAARSKKKRTNHAHRRASLLNYLINALWQAPLLLLCSILAARLLRHSSVHAQHRLWVAIFALEITLPALSLWRSSITKTFTILLHHLLHSANATNANITITFGPVHPHRGFAIPAVWLHVLTFAYTLFLLFIAIRFAFHLARTYSLIRRVRFVAQSASTTTPRIGISSEISSPVALGITRGIILLPLRWRRKLSVADMQAALAHEAAHITRHDFAKNLFYQLLSSPLAFHPAVRVTLSHLAATREMVCDALAAHTQQSPRSYAHSLLRLATATLEQRPTTTPHYGVGIFDAGILERRIMQLTQTPTQPRTARRILQAATLAALFAITTSAALALSFSVGSTAHAQGPQRIASGVMAGELITHTTPVYPPEAKANHIEGTVVLSATIAKDGSIASLQLVSGPPELTKAAWNAVKHWTYHPYMLNGEPTAVETTINVNFHLTH